MRRKNKQKHFTHYLEVIKKHFNRFKGLKSSKMLSASFTTKEASQVWKACKNRRNWSSAIEWQYSRNDSKTKARLTMEKYDKFPWNGNHSDETARRLLAIHRLPSVCFTLSILVWCQVRYSRNCLRFISFAMTLFSIGVALFSVSQAHSSLIDKQLAKIDSSCFLPPVSMVNIMYQKPFSTLLTFLLSPQLSFSWSFCPWSDSALAWLDGNWCYFIDWKRGLYQHGVLVSYATRGAQLSLICCWK